MPPHEDFGLTKSELLEGQNDQRSSLSRFVHSLADAYVYRVAVAPAQAIAQIANLPGSENVSQPTKPSDSFEYHGHIFGEAAAIATHLLLAKKIGGAIISKNVGANAIANLEANAVSNLEAVSLRRQFATGAAFGFAYEGLLRPSTGDELATKGLLRSRLENAASGAAVFGTMHATSGLLKNIGISAQANGYTHISKMLSNAPLVGALSGIPGGIAAAESNALIKELRPASFVELNESIYGMGIVGFAFGGLSRFAETKTQAQNQRVLPSERNASSPLLDSVLAKVESLAAHGDRLADFILGPRPQLAFAMASDNSGFRNAGSVFPSERSRPSFSEPMRMTIAEDLPSSSGGKSTSVEGVVSSEKGGSVPENSATPEKGGAAPENSVTPEKVTVTENAAAPENTTTVQSVLEEASAPPRPLSSSELNAILSRPADLANHPPSDLYRALQHLDFSQMPDGMKPYEYIAERGTRLIEHSATPVVGDYLLSTSTSNGTVYFEPNRNVYAFRDGGYRVVMPTPSGSRLLMRDFRPGSNSKIDYLGGGISPDTHFSDHVGGDLKVITTSKSRYVANGLSSPYEAEFNSPPQIIDAVKASKPVDVLPETVREQLGGWWHNSKAWDGWVIGFDKVSGEAIVSLDDWAGLNWEHNSKVVNDLTGYYPVELRSFKGEPYNVVRDSLGHIFNVQAKEGVFHLNESGAHAFPPSEVWSNGVTLAQRLGLSNTTPVGLRALGGYYTTDGGKIPINIPVELQADPQMFAPKPPSAPPGNSGTGKWVIEPVIAHQPSKPPAPVEQPKVEQPKPADPAPVDFPQPAKEVLNAPPVAAGEIDLRVTRIEQISTDANNTMSRSVLPELPRTGSLPEKFEVRFEKPANLLGEQLHEVLKVMKTMLEQAGLKAEAECVDGNAILLKVENPKGITGKQLDFLICFQEHNSGTPALRSPTSLVARSAARSPIAEPTNPYKAIRAATTEYLLDLKHKVSGIHGCEGVTRMINAELIRRGELSPAQRIARSPFRSPVQSPAQSPVHSPSHRSSLGGRMF